MFVDKYIRIIKERLSKKRFNHSMNVAKEAVKLSKIYNADSQKAEVAGILHDITKEIPYDDQLSFIVENGWKLSVLEKSTPKLLHSISGMLFIRDFLEIQDPDILNAVLYHTTARENMSILEKVIFIADFTSDDRDYKGVNIMREKSRVSLEAAMIEGISFTIKELVDKKSRISCNTIMAYNQVILNNKEMTVK